MMTQFSFLGLTGYNIPKPYGHGFSGAFYFRLIVETFILGFAFSVLCLPISFHILILYCPSFFLSANMIANNFQLQYIYAKYTNQTDPFRFISFPFPSNVIKLKLFLVFLFCSTLSPL